MVAPRIAPLPVPVVGAIYRDRYGHEWVVARRWWSSPEWGGGWTCHLVSPGQNERTWTHRDVAREHPLTLIGHRDAPEGEPCATCGGSGDVPITADTSATCPHCGGYGVATDVAWSRLWLRPRELAIHLWGAA